MHEKPTEATTKSQTIDNNPKEAVEVTPLDIQSQRIQDQELRDGDLKGEVSRDIAQPKDESSVSEKTPQELPSIEALLIDDITDTQHAIEDDVRPLHIQVKGRRSF